MNVLDIVIIVFVVIQAAVWARNGLVRGVFSLGGFWLGIFVGALVAPYTMEYGDDATSQLLIAVITVLGAAFVGESIGRAVSNRLSGFREKLHLERVDGVLGAAFSVFMTLGIAWLLAAMLGGGPVQSLNSQIRNSSIIQAMNRTLPPAPEVLSKISALIGASGFPDVFVGEIPRPIEPVNPPTSGEVAEALQVAGRSTVRVEGIGCGGQLTGSGFVAAPGIVVTNAHVIAGIDQPFAVDVNGRHPAVPIIYDPDLDIAILRTDGLAGASLPLAENDFPRGTTATALGYPGGQSLEANAAGVLRQLDARGRNIYGNDIVVRSVYELQSNIVQGNSGGPLVLSDGTVIGVIFARSQANANIGYAVTALEVAPLLQQAQASEQPVDTGACVDQ